MGGVAYLYNGDGNRIQQNTLKYLLDLQPGLSVVLSETQGANVNRYVHGPRGIHAQKDAASNWESILQDGLGSVRSVTDNAAGVLWSTSYDGYGTAFNVVGTPQTVYGFTGEETDSTGQIYLRARYYNPRLGIFTSLDPFEGSSDRAMSLNGYLYVEGNTINDAVGELIFHNRYSYANSNPVNIVDPSGMIGERPEAWDLCGGQSSSCCQEHWGQDGYRYALCLKDNGQNPCPRGYPVASSSIHPYCVDGQFGDLAGAMWEAQWRPGRYSTANFGWSCYGRGDTLSCQEWLEKAYTQLAQGDPLQKNTADLLDFLGRRNSPPVTFYFVVGVGILEPLGGGAITPFGYATGLENSFLNQSNPSPEQVTIMGHELWHIPQGFDRYSTWGEVSAYNFETNLRRSFGLSNSSWRISLEQYGLPPVRDFCQMCHAKECLKATFPSHAIYAGEAAIWGDNRDCFRECHGLRRNTCN